MVKSKEVFMKDLEKIYNYSSDLKSDLNKFYDCYENDNSDRIEVIEEFLAEIGLSDTTENKNAAIRKLVSLKNNDLDAIFDKLDYDKFRKLELFSIANKWASKFHTKNFERVNFMIGQQELLTEFYRELLLGFFHIGESFTKLDVARDKHLFSINQKVLDKFSGDVSKSVDFIHSNSLMDVFPEGGNADRCYSMLVEDSFEECGFSTESYGMIFEEEVFEICSRIRSLNSVLNELEDDVFGLKTEWMEYFESLACALEEKKNENLISKWRDVDFKWMKVTCPIQIVHPLEYYDDVLRNSIEVSWDLRIVNPIRNDASKVSESMNNMFDNYFESLDNKNNFDDIYSTTKKGLSEVQLYVGKPLMYFADYFKGLISAQVIPNDEFVSLQTGKKIYAFADLIRETQISTPTSKLSVEVFGEDFVRNKLDFAKNSEDAWHKIYSISTIGHEFGHILWKSADSEIKMNDSGNFKNIEEYKATTGGLVAFFKSSEIDEFWKEVFYDVIERAVKLIGWMKVESICPYYCEGLIHLKGLFDSKVLSFNGEKLTLNLSRESFDRFNEWTCNTYEKQFNVYLNKVNADEFLFKFCKKNSDGYFIPIDENLKQFVEWYYKKYEEIGRDIVKLN